MLKVYPPEHPLRSAYLKLNRAKVHIKALERRADKFRALHPDPRFGYETHPDLGSHAFYIEGSRPIPDNWGTVVGDVLTNLRAVLDHLTWALAWRNLGDGLYTLKEREQRAIAFPFAISGAGFKGTAAWRNIIPAARIPMESLQPYHTEDWPELYLLVVLNDFSNMDKHRVVTPVLRQGSLRLGPSSAGLAIDFNDRDYTLVLTAKTTAKLTDCFDPSYSVHIVFEDNPIATGDDMSIPGLHPLGLPIEVFGLMHEFIRDEVLPRFDGFFS